MHVCAYTRVLTSFFCCVVFVVSTAVVAADETRARLTARRDVLEAAEGAHRDAAAIKAVYEALEAVGAASAAERARGILRGLQFTPELMTRPAADLSGVRFGERRMSAWLCFACVCACVVCLFHITTRC